MTDPSMLKYTAEHEWVDSGGAQITVGTIVTIGITDHAAEQLGDIVYVDLPEVGSSVKAGNVIGEVESTKSVGEIYAPMDGEVVAVNETTVEDPMVVGTDPFGAGWLLRIRVAVESQALLSATEYAAIIAPR